MPQGAAGPGIPTGSPWEQNMNRLLAQSNPQDEALRQRMLQLQMMQGTGPQFQGPGQGTAYDPNQGYWGAPTSGPPGNRMAQWHAGARPEGGLGLHDMSQAAIDLGQGMNKMPGERSPRSKGSLGQAQRRAGYAASKPGAMGDFWRQNPVKMEKPLQMGRK